MKTVKVFGFHPTAK